MRIDLRFSSVDMAVEGKHTSIISPRNHSRFTANLVAAWSNVAGKQNLRIPAQALLVEVMVLSIDSAVRC